MWEYALAGILQGIFEWLPVSSEGVVALFSNFSLPQLNSVDFALFLHLGTILAVIIFFWKDIVDLILMKDKKFLRFFIIVTLISGVLGFFVYRFASNVLVGPALLFAMGSGLFLTSWFQKKKIKINLSADASAAVVGLLQAITPIPGVSRSGATIFGLSLTESDPEKILKTSYLISIPVVLGVNGYLYLKSPIMPSNNSLIALLFSFGVGFLTLKFLMNISKKIDFSKFTFIFGCLCFIGVAVYLLAAL
ncbi:MAG: undecaprenyl-diphosphate phosphatase [Candidatus Pacebacteria bacterium]|nr:undecaprenyl-diphosphate phosphatase [Candidatus Paceibacterota bacterium]